ncbi:SWI/SNF-related matrix-associated actin-dependent regulator of chromatin subfamily A member 5-like [Anopheles maculipalpis]|uniref:SWI/SNF-related matrix-associated actin-dependent regulator of chromatin subfamily A member 5-like n=1 Tax=Anopheles maculipalpis TaxID=1496333 RepID=UPI0021590E9D|nr:SWI/SNF-related matrix-associated actin-dependent regulator of chromatin subfamily A member 5-like [Anopheles maculipalpis]
MNDAGVSQSFVFVSYGSQHKLSPETSSTPSPDDEQGIESAIFEEELQRKCLLQLELLENQLAGFAKFNQANGKIKHNVRQKAEGKKQLKTIENLKRADDVTNNNDVDGKKFTESPSFITGTMRDYQVDGLNWLIAMHNNNLNGILADEMGLGKTIQSISMIGYLINVCNLKGPFLVVAPLSTLFNWMQEFARFLPSAKVLHAHAIGKQKKPILAKLADPKCSWNVAVTSYEFINQYSLIFKRINFHYAIIDEAHRAKNELTLSAKLLRNCKIKSMVLLTGTPIHNNLHELWALLNLLLPTFFNNADNFHAWFTEKDCIDPANQQTIRLKNLLKFLMLRRTKLDVAASCIPPKVHIDIYLPPTEQMCLWTHKVLNREVQTMGGDGQMKPYNISNSMIHMRKVIQHPFLIPGAENSQTNFVTDEIVNCSSKMILLDKLLVRLRARGSKVLIFSQYSMVLDILIDYCDWREYEHCVLRGENDNQDRQKQMNEFNRPGSSKFVFLLTTRAGGVGINLMAADTVIFYDMDFNPQMDFQAEDRAHRIGQVRKVHVFRFLVRGSIDELLYHHSSRKRLLDESVIRAKTAGPDSHLFKAAYEYQRKSLMTEGLVDPVAIDEKLDELLRAMGPLDGPYTKHSGLQEDCKIVIPGVPCDLQLDSFLTRSQLKNKRKQEEIVSPLPTKRLRRSFIVQQF